MPAKMLGTAVWPAGFSTLSYISQRRVGAVRKPENTMRVQNNAKQQETEFEYHSLLWRSFISFLNSSDYI